MFGSVGAPLMGELTNGAALKKLWPTRSSADLADVRTLDDEIRRELALQRRAHVMRVGGPEVLVRVDDANRRRIQRARRPGIRRARGAPEPARRCRRRLGLSERAERIFDAPLTQLRRPSPRPLCRVRGLTVNLLIEDAVPAANDGPRVAVHIPRDAQPRRKVIEIAVGQPRRHTRIAREQDPLRRIRHHGGLHARHPRGMTAALLIERDERLVPQAVVHREPADGSCTNPR